MHHLDGAGLGNAEECRRNDARGTLTNHTSWPVSLAPVVRQCHTLAKW